MVRSLQRRLAVAGFGPGPVDGLYGPRTEAAVSRFQAATGLVVDGIAGRRTVAALFAPMPTLRPGAGYGSGGSRLVRGLQQLLAQAGYSTGGIDGLYGPHTGRAVRRFQATRGLRVDGIAHPQTFIDLGKQVRAQRRSRPATQQRTPRQTTTHPATRHPKTASRNPAHAPAPTSARRTRQPSGALSMAWLGVLAAALAVALLPAVAGQTRRRRAARPGSSPTPPEGAGEPVALVHDGDAALAGSPNGRSHNGGAPQMLDRAAQDGADAGTALEDGADAGAALAGDGADAGAAFRLGVLFEEQNELAGAEAAYRRADRQGHPAAASNLGVLLERCGDLQGAEAAYRRADERGDPNGAFNLAVLLEEQNDPMGAEAAYRRADRQRHAAAASNLGVLLERRGDLQGAEAAYRRADEGGDPNGAFNLAVLLEEHNELAAAEAAYRRADQRGPAEVANAARAALLSLRATLKDADARNGGDLHVD